MKASPFKVGMDRNVCKCVRLIGGVPGQVEVPLMWACLRL